MFIDYFKDILKLEKKNSSFLGITKKEHPKWEGWSIIESHKKKGIKVQEIHDLNLLILVENFYRIKYIKERF